LLSESKEKLNVIDNKEVKVKTGEHRVYLSPSALNEIIDMLSWGGFSYKANKIGSSPLHLMEKGKKNFNKIVSFSENLSNGISPKFHSDGFIKPEMTELIVDGQYANSLVSPRSALEYSVNHNAAEYYESPVSIHLKQGELDANKILDTLKDGIYISNLWYLNFSDRNNGRITGLTRFGCFMVENGEYKGPINTMRFDETVYNIFGDKLIGLTDSPQLLMDSSTYEERSTYSSTIPGAIVEDFKMTL
jgi:predicted Zn-dependent protease